MSISAKKRKSLPAQDFALPGKKYPIDTVKRARNALSRGAQNASPAQLSRIKAKVHARYPSIRVTGMGRKVR
jgi:hypothetical protein